MNVGSCDRLAKPSENLGKMHGELSNAYQKPLISGRDVFKHQCMLQSKHRFDNKLTNLQRAQTGRTLSR